MTPRTLPRVLLCALAVSVVSLWLLSGGCPPPPDNNGDNNGNGDSIDDINGGGNGDGGDTTPADPGTGPLPPADNGDGDGGDGGGGNGGGGDTPVEPTTIVHVRVAQTGDQVPGQATGVTFTEFGNPVIDATGRIAFWALYEGTGAKGYGGLYAWDPNAGSTVQRVLDDNPETAGVVPGRTTADYFGRFGGQFGVSPLQFDVVWGAGGRLLFESEVSGEQDSAGIYRWRATDATLVRVADREQCAALFSNASAATFAPTFYLPGVSDAGIAVFGLNYAYFSPPPGAQFFRGEGVFTSNGTTVSVLADTRTSETTPGGIPAQGDTAYYSDIETLTTLNPGGDMLFSARYTNGTGSLGVYLARGDAKYRVIDNRSDATWAGLPTGTQFRNPSGFPPCGIGANGHIALDCNLRIGDVVREAVILWDFTTKKWYELTGPDSTPATSLCSGVNKSGRCVLIANNIPYLVGGGVRKQLDAALPAQLQGVAVTWTAGTGAINNNDHALLAFARTGGTGLVFWTGSKLLLVADSAASIPAAATAVSTISDPRRDRPARTGTFNDLEQIAFKIAGGTGQAIYYAQAQ